MIISSFLITFAQAQEGFRIKYPQGQQIAATVQTDELSTKLKKDIIDSIPGFLSQMQIFRQYLNKNNSNVTKATSQYLQDQAPSWLNLSKKELDKLKNYKPQVKSINDLFGVIKQTADLPGIVIKVRKGLNQAKSDLQNLKPLFNNLAGTIQYIGDVGEDLESVGPKGSATRENIQSLFEELKELGENQPAKLNALGVKLKAFIGTIEAEIKKLIKNIDSIDIKNIKNTASKLMNINVDDLLDSVKSLDQSTQYKKLQKTILLTDFDSFNKNKAKIKEELNVIKSKL
jgi:hypothetical protein